MNKKELIDELMKIGAMFRIAGENLFWAAISILGLLFRIGQVLWPKLIAALKSENQTVDVAVAICLILLAWVVAMFSNPMVDMILSPVKGWDISEPLKTTIVAIVNMLRLVVAAVGGVFLGMVMIHDGFWKPSPKWQEKFFPDNKS